MTDFDVALIVGMVRIAHAQKRPLPEAVAEDIARTRASCDDFTRLAKAAADAGNTRRAKAFERHASHLHRVLCRTIDLREQFASWQQPPATEHD